MDGRGLAKGWGLGNVYKGVHFAILFPCVYGVNVAAIVVKIKRIGIYKKPTLFIS